MPCSCGSSAAADDRYVNVKADGTSTKIMTKAEALASAQAEGGYIKKA